MFEPIEVTGGAKIKAFDPVAIANNSYRVFQDANLKNRLIVGYRVGGIADIKDVHVVCVYSDDTGLNIVIRNDSGASVTPTVVYIWYLDD